jgi:hypothetical protein
VTPCRLLLPALLLAGGTGSVDYRLGHAPDAVLVHGSSEHGAHRWVVRRPTVWQVDRETRILDDRMTVALMDPTTATWHAAVRLDELAALQFASELQTAMHGVDPASAVQGVQLAFQESPRDGNLRGRTLIDAGRWTAPEPQSGVPVRIDLVDDTGHVHMRVECDAISAGALRRDLLLAASARP